MSHPLSKYEPGHRVRVTQQVPRLRGNMYATVEGIIVRFGQQKTGSWYAHAKDDKLWLDRLEMRKDDGELVVLNLDQFSTVERIKVPLPNGLPIPAAPLKPGQPKPAFSGKPAVAAKPAPAKPAPAKPAPAKSVPAKSAATKPAPAKAGSSKKR